MSVGTADVFVAINTVWDSSTLDAQFKALWAADVVQSQYTVLNDQEASPEQPFPYCVLEVIIKPRSISRSSGVNSIKINRKIQEFLITFHVHADKVEGDTRSSKAIASHLAEEVMKVFGGHPTVAPTVDLELSHGDGVSMTLQTDYALRTQLYRYDWVVSYIFRADIPVCMEN
jgi:hypothetical protein